MSETKVFSFPESGNSGGGGMMSMLAPLLQQRGVDPNLLAMMNNKSGGFGSGEGSWFIWVIFLFFLMGWGGNGWGGGRNNGTEGLSNLVNNDAGRELLMSAIQGNNQAINSLATNLNCSVGQIQQAVNGLMTQVQGIGSQVGLTSQQIINSVQLGNNQLAQAMADCCCRTQNAITTQGYENQLSLCNQTNTLVTTANANTQNLKDANLANTQAIIAKLDAAETRAMQEKIYTLQEAKGLLQTQLNLEHQTNQFGQMIGAATAPINSALAGLQTEVNDIKCKQPETIPVQYQPVTAIPNCVAAQYGLYGINNLSTGLWG